MEQLDSLLYKIAELIDQNNLLTDQIRRLNEKVNNLSMVNEELGLQYATPNTDTVSPQSSDTYKSKSVSILFANIHWVGSYHTGEDPKKLFDRLDDILFEIEQKTKNQGIVKTNSIGDTLLYASGINKRCINSPVQLVYIALQMQHIIQSYQENHLHSAAWTLGIGIHSGPVTVTTKNNKNNLFELKGETLRIATRIENTSKAGSVVVSGATYAFIKDFFVCEYSGSMPVKYFGEMELYQVKSLKPKLSDDNFGLNPNHLFYNKLRIAQFTDLQDTVIQILEEELPPNLYYHNVKHTLDVLTEAEILGWAEGISEEDILLVKTAALFHDTGHVVSYDNHEYYSSQKAREILPDYSYSPEQIDRICELIMATKVPTQPKNLLEEIICDSDLDYLGRMDFIPISNSLYKELSEQNKINSVDEWNRIQIEFITNHQYFTRTARRLRDVNKQKQIDRIKSQMEEEDEFVLNSDE